MIEVNLDTNELKLYYRLVVARDLRGVNQIKYTYRTLIST